MNYTNNTGYTSGSDTEKNGINIIPSSKITMKNVTKSLTLIPVINGKPQHSKKIVAKPGDDDIDFGPEVTSVIEIPMAQSQWGTIEDPYKKKNPFAFNSDTQHTYGSMGNTDPTNQNTPYPSFFDQYPAQENSSNQQEGVMLDPTTISDSNSSATTMSIFQKPEQLKRMEQNKINNTLLNNYDENGNAINTGSVKDENNNNNNVKYLSGINPYGSADLGTSMYKSGIGFGISKYGKSSGQKAAGLTLGIASAAQGILGSARNFFSGMGEAKRYGQAEEEMKRKRLLAMQAEGEYDANINVPGQGQPFGYAKGGYIDYLQKGGYSKLEEENTEKRTVEPKMLTGNFLEGNDNHPDPNAELERGEYVRTPEGQSMEIIGKKHSEGGELLNLPVDTKIISDYLKIGASNAKNIQKFFDVKVSAGSTFATVVDKYRKSIGLTEILNDEEEIIKKIAAQEEVTNENTKDLNYKVLSKRLTAIQEQKAPLEEKLTEFVDYVFEVQEGHKEEKGITADNDKKQNGGTVDDVISAFVEQQGVDPQEIISELESLSEEEQQVMMTEMMRSVRTSAPSFEEEQPQASPEEIISAFAEQHGVDPQEVIANLESLSPEEQQQVFQEMAASVSEGGQPAPQEEAPVEMQAGGTIDDFDEKYASYNGFGTYAHDDLPSKQAAAQRFVEQYYPDKAGKINFTNKSQEELDAIVTALRKDKTTSLPETSKYFGRNVVADRAGLQFMLDKKMVSPETLTSMGVQLSKDGTVKRGAFDTLNDDQKQTLKAHIDETLALPQNNALSDEYAIQTYDDGIWDRREYMVEPKRFKSAADRDAWLKEKNYKETDKGVYATDKEGLFVRPIVEEGTTAPAPGPNNEQSDFRALQKDDDSFLMLPPQLPGRENLPPNLLMPTIRQTRAFQADPLAISPNSTIRETSRSVQSQQNMLAQLDPSLAAANIGNLTAEEATANANAIEKANLANQADARQVSSINEDRQKATLDTNLGLQATYEQQAQTALQNFYDENRNFITKRNNDNIENWNTVNKINAYNAANPNYKMTSSGAIVQVGKPFFWADGAPLAGTDEVKKDPKTGKTYAKRNGKMEEIYANETKPGLATGKKGGKISFSEYLKKKK